MPVCYGVTHAGTNTNTHVLRYIYTHRYADLHTVYTLQGSVLLYLSQSPHPPIDAWLINSTCHYFVRLRVFKEIAD